MVKRISSLRQQLIEWIHPFTVEDDNWKHNWITTKSRVLKSAGQSLPVRDYHLIFIFFLN